MSNISPVSTVGAGTAAAVTTPTTAEMRTGLDYNAFLQLLIAQIRNQDPLSPMDPTEQMSQLASFANVEQTIMLNQKLETMITVSSLTQANSLIGRTITSPDGAISGPVKSVTVRENQAIATLADGRTVPLGAGVRIE